MQWAIQHVMGANSGHSAEHPGVSPVRTMMMVVVVGLASDPASGRLLAHLGRTHPELKLNWTHVDVFVGWKLRPSSPLPCYYHQIAATYFALGPTPWQLRGSLCHCHQVAVGAAFVGSPKQLHLAFLRRMRAQRQRAKRLTHHVPLVEMICLALGTSVGAVMLVNCVPTVML